MTTALNLYATKVFSEHPVALWALDDTSDYVAKISRNNQDLSNWYIAGGTAVDALTDTSFQTDKPTTEPFPGTYVNGINEILGNGGIVTIESNTVFQPEDLNLDLGSFGISTYVFSYDRTVEVRLGYSYYDGVDTVEVIRSLVVPAAREWASVSQTFSLPETFSNLRIILEFAFEETSSEYQFAINGINVGQLAEEFFIESIGVIPEAISEQIDIDALGIQALPYGIEGANGYYLSDGNRVYAKNSSLPLVYGAFNSTLIRPFTDKPSLILPGFGFMNKSGQYQKLTLEFWAKIQNNSFEARRIIGPIASTDGVYTDGPFLKLKVGQYLGSHYIGEWDRPMLVNVRYSPKNVSMLINGEEVISIPIDADLLDFPDVIDENNNEQDWIGFYAYDDVPAIQLDCVGIYPYEVPAIVSKRRFVFGQAVDLPNNIRGLKSNNSIFMDQSFAKNTKNYLYPKIGRWSDGVVENINPNPESLSLPDYQLPNIVFNNKTVEDWYSDLYDNSLIAGYPHISMKPNSSWASTEGYLLLESLNSIKEEAKALYGVFSIREYSLDEQILFEMVNSKTGDIFGAYLEWDTVSYILQTKRSNGEYLAETIYSSTGLVTDAAFLAGIHIPRIISAFESKLSRFFSFKQNIRVYIAGNRDLDKTFLGRIHSFGISSKRNLSKIENEFLLVGLPTNFADGYTEIILYDGGYPDTSDWDATIDGGISEQSEFVSTADANGMFLVATTAIDHVATYTVLPQNYFGAFKLDIGVDSYWEDYLPLSYFASYVVDGAGEKYRDLDFLQINLDYPIFNNYTDDLYDSSGSSLKSYVTFYNLSDGAAENINNIQNTQLLPKSGVVQPASEWTTTKYEITDDTIIYPPIGENFEKLGMRIHIEIISAGIETNPVVIRSMKISSRSLGYSKNRIGNRFGADMYPYRSIGLYSDYKIVSPFSIYKNTMPYLYLAGNSGIRVRDHYSTSDNRGLEIPINKNSASFFKVGSLQMLTKYERDEFPDTPVKIFDIQDKNKTINFYLVAYPNNTSRGYIFALNGETGEPEYGLIYNLDGRMVKRLTLNSNIWAAIGISFEAALDMSQSTGYLRITNPMFVNNISYYQITEADEATRLAYRKWYAVRSEPDNPLDWDYWNESTWQEVLYLTESDPRIIDPSNIYKQYTGTDRIVNQSGASLVFGNYRYSAFKDLRWSRTTLNSA